jgi:hypothetical protein
MCELREMRAAKSVAATRVFDKARRVRALALLTTLLAVSAHAAERRGAFAFHYRAPLTPRQLRWFSRFDLLVTHDPLPRAQVAALHARGTKLLVYEWSVAVLRHARERVAARTAAEPSGRAAQSRWPARRRRLRGGGRVVLRSGQRRASRRARACDRAAPRRLGYDGVLWAPLYFGMDVRPILAESGLAVPHSEPRLTIKGESYEVRAIPFRVAGESESSTILTRSATSRRRRS